MDVWGVYVSDSSMSYGGMRGAYYRDYEQFPYGSLEQKSTSTTPTATNITMTIRDPYTKVQEKCQQIQSEKVLKKECPFCKEHKRRPLTDYMRKRGTRKHHESICEGEEEEEEDEEDVVQCAPMHN